MIAADVTLPLLHIEKVVETEEAIELWLLDNVGTHTPHRDCVDDDHPWSITRKWAVNVYHFAREQDAILFQLKWV